MDKECKHCLVSSKAASTLNDCGFEDLTNNHAKVTFKKGDSIIKQGNYSTNVIFLRKGLVKIHISGPTNEHIVRIVKAPNYLGLPTTVGNKINQYSITAISDAEICFIDLTTFRKLLNENPRFSYEIIMELCNNELESFRRCANRTQKLTRGNLAEVLLEFSNQIYKTDSFTLPINQIELGNLVDTSRESISRILSEFDKDGIIRMNGKSIDIINKKSLLKISKNG